MSLRKTTLLLSGASLLAPFSVFAEDLPQGLSGSVGLFAFFGSEESQLNTDDDNATTTSLDKKGKSISGGTALPGGELFYTMDSTTLFLSAADEGFQVGVRQQFGGAGALTLAYLPGVRGGEVWKDPFVTNAKRTTATMDSQGVLVGYDHDFFSTQVVMANSEISASDEQSGKVGGKKVDGTTDLTAAEQSQLDRNADFLSFSLSTTLPLTQQILVSPSIEFSSNDAKGKANSYSSFGGGLTFIAMADKHTFQLGFGAEASSYDQANPVFNKKQDTTEMSVYTGYVYAEPFGLANTDVQAFIGYTQADSEITFYDSNAMFATVGMSYNF